VSGTIPQADRGVDPVLSEILVGACRALVEEADDLLERASMGMVIRESRDYCSVLCDPNGNLIVAGSRDLPVFVGTIQFTVQAVIDAIGVAEFRPGDVYLANDPWSGGTHFNDLRLVAPVYHAARLIGYTCSCGHVADIGGVNPGSFAISARTSHAEGLRIVPVLFFRDGELRLDILRFILSNIRMPETTEGDLRAMLAAVHRSTDRLQELADLYGTDVLLHWMETYQDYGEACLREQIRQLEPGTYRWVDWIDADPATGEPIRVELAATIADDDLTFDFTGTASATGSGANSPFPSTAAILYVVVASLFREGPLNHGLMRAVDIIAPIDTVIHATYPTAVSAMASTTFDIVAACALGAFSQVAPDRVIAASYNLQSFVTSGTDPRTGKEFVTYSWGPGGWGAGLGADGRTAMALYTTTTLNIPCEDEERRVPFIIEEYAIVPDSGGAGQWRGGNCLRRVFRFGYDGTLTSLAGRGLFPIWGLFQGQPGSPHSATIESATGSRSVGLLADGIRVSKGDLLVYVNGGGGGYGSPLERDPAAVLEDVLDGWVTPSAAADIYGVALVEVPETSLTTTFELDERGTVTLRAQRKAAT
jgi:N-methylhydantoinase B